MLINFRSNLVYPPKEKGVRAVGSRLMPVLPIQRAREIQTLVKDAQRYPNECYEEAVGSFSRQRAL